MITITRYEKAMGLNPEDFKQIIGVRHETFEAMLEILAEAYVKKHKKGGRPAKLPLFDQLFMALKYWRQYVTQKELAFEFEVGEATAHDTIIWVEDTLVKSGKFSLPGKKALLDDTEIEVILVDVTESPIERPKKNRGAGIPAKRKSTP
jgi:hypothetical protein